MKKKLLIVIIILSSILFVNAKELPTFEVGSYNANIGDTVTVPIEIKNNSGFSFIGFKLDYDTNCLEYVDSKIIGLEDFSLKQITNNKNNKVVMYAITINKDVIMKSDKKIAEIKFKVKKDAKASDLKLEVTDYGTFDNKTIQNKVINGKISLYENVNVNDKIVPDDTKEDIKYESSNPNIAIVNEDGTIIFKDSGEVTITKKNSKDEIIEEKSYLVGNTSIKNKDTNNNLIKYILISIIGILIIGFIIIILKRKSKNK